MLQSAGEHIAPNHQILGRKLPTRINKLQQHELREREKNLSNCRNTPKVAELTNRKQIQFQLKAKPLQWIWDHSTKKRHNSTPKNLNSHCCETLDSVQKRNSLANWIHKTTITILFEENQPAGVENWQKFLPSFLFDFFPPNWNGGLQKFFSQTPAENWEIWNAPKKRIIWNWKNVWRCVVGFHFHVLNQTFWLPLTRVRFKHG